MDALISLAIVLLALGLMGGIHHCCEHFRRGIVPTHVRLRIHPMSGPFVVGQQVIVVYQPTKAGQPLPPSSLANPTWTLASSGGTVPPQEHSTDGNSVTYVFSDVGTGVFVQFSGTTVLQQTLAAVTDNFDIVAAPDDSTIPDAVTLTITSQPFTPPPANSP